jgi:purine catabolism regulator
VSQLLARAALAAFHPPAGARLVGLAIGVADPPAALAAVDDAARAVHVPLLRAALDDAIYAVAAVDAEAQPATVAVRLLAALDRALGSRSATLALGPVATDLADAGLSVREAQTTLALARELGVPARLVSASGMAVDRFVAMLLDHPELERIVSEQIGDLVAHDRERRSDLVGTLGAYLAHGGSKAATARALGIRRQSLYQRLARIEEVLGARLDDAERQVALVIALKAHALLRARGHVGVGAAGA